MLVVDGRPPDVGSERRKAAVDRLATLPCLVVGRGGWDGATHEDLELVDLVAVDEPTLARIMQTVSIAPIASAALAVHLRAADHRSTVDGLVAESALYSTLQSGPEFTRWRRKTPIQARVASTGHAVLVTRVGAALRVTLARPESRNALSAQMRAELLDALSIAEDDTALHVVINGQGPSFCAGGDLGEFGSFEDPATAHLLRLEQSIGAVLTRIAGRVTVHLHGACYGSGIELPAFAGRVVAHPDTAIALPELGFGLVPGAGGTVSIPARIGRHATALLAFTRHPIDAQTALRWGLIDELATDESALV